MELSIRKNDWIFLFICLCIGILAEEAFFRGRIGISYLAFIVIFYTVFFLRFRAFSFTHQRFGYLVLISIWLLAAGYYLNDTTLFYILNIFVIPALVVFHLALITSPKKLQWNHLFFIFYILIRIWSGIRYSAFFTKYIARLFKRSRNEERVVVWKKILIGIVVSVPVLFVVLSLLISADTQFQRLINNLFDLDNVRIDYIFRVVIILLYTLGFFGYMQVLLQRNVPSVQKEGALKTFAMDGIVTLTVLVLLNLVYALFIAVQFTYFFSSTLEDGYTYAEYARRGFFELLFVTIINLTVTIFVIWFTESITGLLKKLLRLALTLLVLSSGVLLISAFMRMTMYEEAYGFTFTRVLVSSFMIFLLIIFTYTLIKIWFEKLSLFHFYFIASLIYYVGINVVNIDRVVVDLNIARYEETGEIDIQYLDRLSATGVNGLIELYEENPDIPGLKDLLSYRRYKRDYLKSDSIQSLNITRERTFQKLRDLNL